MGEAGKGATARLNLRIALSSGALLGPGKVRLLEQVRDSGSISEAARRMGMSYKRAWDLVSDMNRAFRHPVVEANAGGARGGGAHLTDFGRDVVARYRRMEAVAHVALGDDLTALDREARPPDRGG